MQMQSTADKVDTGAEDESNVNQGQGQRMKACSQAGKAL